MTEVESVGRLRVSSRGRRSAFSGIALSYTEKRGEERVVTVLVVFLVQIVANREGIALSDNNRPIADTSIRERMRFIKFSAEK